MKCESAGGEEATNNAHPLALALALALALVLALSFSPRHLPTVSHSAFCLIRLADLTSMVSGLKRVLCYHICSYPVIKILDNNRPSLHCRFPTTL